MGGARLLFCLIARLCSLFIPQFVSSATNLTLGIKIEKKMNSWGTNKLAHNRKDQYTLIEKSDLLTALSEYTDFALLNNQ